MLTKAEIKSRQLAIASEFGVQKTIDVRAEIERRVNFMINQVVNAKKKGFVLGISGGQDSYNAGGLAQIAVDRLNKMTGTNDYKFVAMRLPYGVQKDEADAQASLEAIKPTEILTYNIKPAVDAAVAEWKEKGHEITDFVKGNRKARERMLAQYDIAATENLLVIGTDHAAEAITGFYTKWGDGACDLAPLSTLNKRQGRLLAAALKAPEIIITKKPTADLEDNKPQLSDEESLGLTYDQIDDFLEGKEINEAAAFKLITQYDKTQHKRKPIPAV
ncbi:MAG: synthetase [Bacillales bacterium]|jgi:NAD+ synthase|nr:synthetase [Bacillales bacterium]